MQPLMQSHGAAGEDGSRQHAAAGPQQQAAGSAAGKQAAELTPLARVPPFQTRSTFSYTWMYGGSVAIVWGWVLITIMNVFVGLALSEMASGEHLAFKGLSRQMLKHMPHCSGRCMCSAFACTRARARASCSRLLQVHALACARKRSCCRRMHAPRADTRAGTLMHRSRSFPHRRRRVLLVWSHGRQEVGVSGRCLLACLYASMLACVYACMLT